MQRFLFSLGQPSEAKPQGNGAKAVVFTGATTGAYRFQVYRPSSRQCRLLEQAGFRLREWSGGQHWDRTYPSARRADDALIWLWSLGVVCKGLPSATCSVGGNAALNTYWVY